jgi:hypothetical protein
MELSLYLILEPPGLDGGKDGMVIVNESDMNDRHLEMSRLHK